MSFWIEFPVALRLQLLKSGPKSGAKLTCVCCPSCWWWQPCLSDPHCDPCRSRQPHGAAAYGDKKSSEETSYTGYCRGTEEVVSNICYFNTALPQEGSSLKKKGSNSGVFDKQDVPRWEQLIWLYCAQDDELLSDRFQIITLNSNYTILVTGEHRVLDRNTISQDLPHNINYNLPYLSHYLSDL